MSALERAARALRDEMPSFVGEPYPHQSEFGASYIDCQEVDFLDLAHAVLMSVRDSGPPDEMLSNNVGGDERANQTWSYLIDAILNEKDATND